MPLALPVWRLPRRLFGPARARTIERGDGLPLVGDRVLLRPLEESDADAMFAYASDPEVTRYLPWQPAERIETVRSFLQEQVVRRKRGESLGLAIVGRESDQMIGSIDLMGLQSESGGAELGYLLARPYWGRGLMTEAGRLILKYGFEGLKVTRVSAFADTENAGSRRVLTKLGMRMAGSEYRLVKNEERLYVRYEIERPTIGAQA